MSETGHAEDAAIKESGEHSVVLPITVWRTVSFLSSFFLSF